MSEDRTKPPPGYTVAPFDYFDGEPVSWVFYADDEGPAPDATKQEATESAWAHYARSKRDGLIEALRWVMEKYESDFIVTAEDLMRFSRARLAELEGRDDG